MPLPHAPAPLSVRYRMASEADLPALCALEQEVYLNHHAARPGTFTRPDQINLDTLARQWREALADLQGAVFVAETDRLAGFVSARVEPETQPQFNPVCFCRIGTVGVTESLRGKGIGRGLMGRLTRWAAERGASEVQLNVWTFNVRAIRLYEELGFEPQAQFMVKQLVPASEV